MVRKKILKKNKVPQPEQEDSLLTTQPQTDNLPKITKSYPRRTIYLAACAGLMLIGFIFAIMYVFTMNMALGFLGIPFLFGGGLGFYYQWGKAKDTLQVRYLGDVPLEQVNSINLYPDEIEFANVDKPKGFIWDCENDGKQYYFNIFNQVTGMLEPFGLPDQQYCDPRILAQRYMTLPAHRKLFARRPDILKKLRPFIAAIIAIGLWILIITTTGGNTGA